MKQVPCPRCGKLSLFSSQNKWRPFCTERCKMIDLGEWASESYRVPTQDHQPPPESSDEG